MNNNNYKIGLIISWEKLDEISEDWNRLWLATQTLGNELYNYKILKDIVLYKEKENGHPFVITLSDKNSKIVGLAPFYFRIREHKKLKIKTLTFFPIIITNRHSFIFGENHILGNTFFLKEIMVLIRKFKIDILDFKGIPESISNIYHPLLVKYIPKLKPYHPDLIPGNRSSDLLAIKVQDTFDSYLNHRKRQVRSNIKRTLKNSPNYKIWRSNKYIKEHKDVQTIFSEIKTIENNSWQKEEGANYFTKHSDDFCINFLSQLMSNDLHDICFLYVSDQLVAFYLGSLIKNRGNCHFIGYNKDFRNISPGILMLTNVIKENIRSQKITSVNLYGASGKDSIYKNQLAECKDISYDYFVYCKTPKANVLTLLTNIKYTVKTISNKLKPSK